MNWAQAFAGVEQALGICAVSAVLLLVVVWGAIKVGHLHEEEAGDEYDFARWCARHEGRTWRRR